MSTGAAARQAVWAGLVNLAEPGEADSLAEAVAEAGGVAVASARLDVLAAFADAEAAGRWLAGVLAERPEARAALAAMDRDAEPDAAEARLLDLVEVAAPGEAAMAPGLTAPAALAPPEVEPGEAAATRLAPVPRPPSEATRGGEPGADLPPGFVLSHTYEIERLIARGGMGSVYRARHVELGSRHAIKVISPEHARDDHVAGLFRREAESLRSIRHEAVIGHEGVIRDEHGRLYLVMEYADGPSLAEVLQDGPLAPDQVEVLARRIGAGLEAAHEKGIVHRDISPDNIVLVAGDVSRALLIDFGIARNLDTAKGTLIGSQFAGKYGYASPEQLGLFGGQVDRRSDLYSFALVLAAALGRPIDLGRSPAEAARNRETRVDVSHFPAPWAGRLARMLEPDPNARPARYRDLIETTSPVRETAPPRRGRGAMRGAVALLLVGAGAGLWAFGVGPFGGDDDAPGPVAQGDGTVETPAPTEAEPSEAADEDERPAEPPEGGDGVPEAGSPEDAGSDGGAPDAPSEAEGPQESDTPPETREEEGGAESPAAPAEDAPDTDAGPPDQARPPRARVAAAVAEALSGAGFEGVCQRIGTELREAPAGYRVTLSGVIETEADARAARRAVATLDGVSRVRDEITIAAQPFCGFLALATPARRASPPHLTLNQSDAAYRDGERISLELSPTGSGPRHLYVAYIDRNGDLAHLLPNPVVRDNRLAPGETLALGRAREGGGHRNYAAAEPHGRNLIFAVSASRELFEELRAEVETAQTYLPALRAAIGRAERAGAQVSVAWRFLETLP